MNRSPLTVIREAKGLSIRGLSERCSVSPTTIWAIENHKKSPTVRMLKKLGEALECDPKILID